MKRLNGRRMILWIMTLVLCVTTCMPAFASVGDRTLIHSNRDTSEVNIRGIYPLGEGFCIVTDGSEGQAILKYATLQSEPEKYVRPEPEYPDDMEGLMDGESDGEIPAVPGENQEGTDVPAEPGENGEKTEEPAVQEEPQKEIDIFADMDWASEDENGVVINYDAESEDSGNTDFFNYEYIQNYFAWNNDLYGLVVDYIYDEETQTSKQGDAEIRHIKLENGEIVIEKTDLPALDLSFTSDEENGMSFGLNGVFTDGDYLIVTYYGSNMGMNTAAVNLKDGTSVLIPEDATMSGVFRGPEGSLIICRQDWNMGGSTFKLSRMDLATQKEEPVTEFTAGGYQLTACYDQEKNTLYYVCDGEVYALQMAEGQQPESVNECGIAPDGLMLTPDGYIIAWTYSAAVARNTDPTKRADVTLRVSNSGSNYYLEDAVLDMNESRGDISVILKEESNSINSDVLQSMMNQEDYIDVYILEYESKAFNALLNRGYLKDLGDNKDIATDVERMYPYLKDAFKQDGKIICTPVQVNGQVLGINLKTWAKLGGTEEELPKTWDEFFDWLEKDVPERIVGSDIKVCEDVGTSFKGTIRLLLLYQYQMWMDAKGGEYQFNTPFLKDLLTRLNNLNTEALGMKDAYDEDDYGYIISYDADYVDPLISTYTQPTVGGNYNGAMPLPLAFDENDPPIVAAQVSVGFVNPYSKHPEEAREFLALILKNTTETAAATLFTDKTEPIRETRNDDWVESNKQWVESIEKQLEEVEDGQEKADLEESLKEAKAQLEYSERWSWRVSPDDLANYQKLLPNLKVMDYLFLYDLFNPGDEEEMMSAYSLFYGEDSDPEPLLDMIDKKIQTIRKEGN